MSLSNNTEQHVMKSLRFLARMVSCSRKEQREGCLEALSEICIWEVSDFVQEASHLDVFRVL